MKKLLSLLSIILLISACEDTNPTESDLDSNITINNYGTGTVCGGAVMSFDDKVYRSFEGGIASLDEELNINESDKIGDFNQSEVYHVEIIDGDIWFSLTDYSAYNEVRILNSSGSEIASYQDIGIAPGDFTKWTSDDKSWIFIANEGNYGSSNGSTCWNNNERNKI